MTTKTRTTKTRTTKTNTTKTRTTESASTPLVSCVVAAQLRADAAWDALKWGVDDDEGAGARWLSAERDLDACKDAALTASAQLPVTAKHVELAFQSVCERERALHMSREEHSVHLRAHERLERQLIKARAELSHAQWLVTQSDTTLSHMRSLTNAAGDALSAAVDTYSSLKNMCAK